MVDQVTNERAQKMMRGKRSLYIPDEKTGRMVGHGRDTKWVSERESTEGEISDRTS